MAESFGALAERYDRTRPRYPQPLVDRILAASPGRDVLDVGIGTGISARPFQAAGCRVLGIDPDEKMAEFARRAGLDVEVAKFEDWDSAGRAFDAVIAGQAWHWVDPVIGAAKAAEVLRPRGRLAVFWNVFEYPGALAEAIAATYLRVLPDSPFARGIAGGMAAYSTQLGNAAAGIRAISAFGEPEEWQFDWEQRYTRDQYLQLIPTAGGHSTLPPAKLDALLRGIGGAIDAAGGSFTMRYTAAAITAARAGSS
jgi:SAM-dependent methyltransferase